METGTETCKVRILEESDRLIKLELVGEDHTLLAPLTARLLENEQVDLATYSVPHALRSSPILVVKMKAGDPLEAVKAALASLASEFEEFELKYRAAIV
jgi:DNA-directed RNA polymerase subunit L